MTTAEILLLASLAGASGVVTSLLVPTMGTLAIPTPGMMIGEVSAALPEMSRMVKLEGCIPCLQFGREHLKGKEP